MLRGVDVASFQGSPASWRAAAGDISWAAVKFTELGVTGSRYVSPDAAADWAYLRSRGLGRIAYMFGHPSASASASAAFFYAELRDLGLDDGDGVALDLEVTDGRAPAAVAAWGRQVLRLLHEMTRRRPLLYTFLSFAEAGNCAGMGQYPLWIADPSSPPGKPRVPGPWTAWHVHQYGITGSIDRDLAAWPDLAHMRAAIGHAPPEPPARKHVTLPEDLMLLSKGVNAVTPLAFAPAVRKIRFFCADGAARVSCQFVGVAEVRSLSLTFTGGSQAVDVPAGKDAAKVTRLDAGTGDVSVAVE